MQTPAQKCPSCDRPLPSYARHCPYCNEQLSSRPSPTLIATLFLVFAFVLSFFRPLFSLPKNPPLQLFLLTACAVASFAVPGRPMPGAPTPSLRIVQLLDFSTRLLFLASSILFLYAIGLI